MITYTLTVRVGEGVEHDVEECLHEAAIQLVEAHVPWTLTEQHEDRPEPAAMVAAGA
jgi:hypothetical protein